MASNNHLGSSSRNNLILHIDLNAPLQENDSGRKQATHESECGSNLSEIISHEKCHDDETTRTCAEQKGKRIAECTREHRWNTLVQVAVDAHERECEPEELAEENEENEDEEEGEKVVIKMKAKKKKSRSRRVYNINDDDEEVFEVPIVRTRRGRAVTMPNKYKDTFLGPLVDVVAAKPEVVPRRKSAANRRSR